MTDKIKYEDAFSELQEIVANIEEGEISVDELSVKVKRAAELIKLCKDKLISTEEDVQNILKEIQTPNIDTITESSNQGNNDTHSDSDLPF